MISQPFRERIQELVDAQGWTDNTVLGLALDYIEETQESADFIGYLKEVQRQENSGYMYEDVPPVGDPNKDWPTNPPEEHVYNEEGP